MMTSGADDGSSSVNGTALAALPPERWGGGSLDARALVALGFGDQIFDEDEWMTMCEAEGCVMGGEPLVTPSWSRDSPAAFTPEYRQVHMLAWLAIVLYPICIPALYTALLCLASKALRTETETPLSAALGFLHREFEPRYFWWEILEVVKKLVLVGFAAIIRPGSITQLVIAMILSLTLMQHLSAVAPDGNKLIVKCK